MSKGLLCAVLTLAVCSAAAQALPYGIPLTADQPGDYVVYHDTRNDPASYLGILYLGGPNYDLRRYEPDSDRVTEAVVSLLPGEDLQSAPVKVIEPGAGPEAVRRLVADLFGCSARRETVDETGFPAEILVRGPSQETGSPDLVSTYRFWVPVFQLFGSYREGDPARGLALVSAGHALRRDDPAFFAYAGPVPQREGPHIHLAEKEAHPVRVDGLFLPLDGNWHPAGDRVFRIDESTAQDAVLVVENLDLQSVAVPNVYALMKYTLLGKEPGVCLLSDGVRIYERGESLVLEFTVMNQRTRMVTRQLTRFISRGDQVFSMETLAALDTVYEDNRGYFDHILFGD